MVDEVRQFTVDQIIDVFRDPRDDPYRHSLFRWTVLGGERPIIPRPWKQNKHRFGR